MARQVAKAVQGVGLLPGTLGLFKFEDRSVPAFARPCRIFPVQPGKNITTKTPALPLTLQFAHDEGVF